ncbi:MAG: C4-dicarboxylate ABC transporter [Bacteroidetes bacterium B1(2017)]|nr:MAG: C4-dicarboxylate ABC transporter [Bacteroidetes bacterium B1(2017)]
MFWVQLSVLLTLILFGSQMKGVGLGLMGALGTLIFVYGFNLPIGKAPIDVMLIILCVVTATSSLQASGGMDYLISIAENIIRKNPKHITFVGPFVTFVFTLLAGTAHISYSLLPIISEVSLKKRVRPERPLSISVVAAHFGITASPISAASVGMLGELNTIQGNTLGLIDVLSVVFPATLIGLFFGALVANNLGKELDKDPIFLEKLKDPVFSNSLKELHENSSKHSFSKTSKYSVWVFLLGVVLIVLFGVFPSIKKTSMAESIELIMLCVALVNVFIAKVNPVQISQGSIFKTGSQAVLCIFGVVWMSDTFVSANQTFLTESLHVAIANYPWLFSFAIFFAATLLFSQAATVKAIMPLGIKLGILPASLISMYPAVNADFVIPSYPTLVAAINFDKTGTTKIGKYLLNHSFMLPGLVTTIVTILSAFLLSSIIL